MINIQWFSWINSVLSGVITFVILGILFIVVQGSEEIICTDPEAKECRLPKSSFTLSNQAYVAIGEPVLSLKTAPPTIQLPDLRQQLIYYGKNGRPDARSNNELLHFSFMGTKQTASIQPGEKLYLRYDKSIVPSKYTFSPDNAPTSLWLTAEYQGQEAMVSLAMKNEQGNVVAEPPTLAHFKLTEKEFIRHGGVSWNIGTWHVDGSLLVRQKAKWYGPDTFLELHGGEEFAHVIGKQRVEFGEPEETYSVFIGEGDCLIWENNRWREVQGGKDSLGHPLLVVKKVDERLITLELWDIGGRGKVLLNLLKTADPWMAQFGQIIQNQFKFVGARTRTKYVFEVNQERMILSPKDWLVYHPNDGGWIKLETAQAVDDYVERKNPAALFVFDDVTRVDGQQAVVGKLFSPSRSEYKDIEIPIHQGAGVSLTKNSKDEESESEDEDDFDDDDDDEDTAFESVPVQKMMNNNTAQNKPNSPNKK